MISNNDKPALLQEEILFLRQRVAELEQHLSLSNTEETASHSSDLLLEAIYNQAPYVIAVANVVDKTTIQYVDVNPLCAQISGIPAEQWIGKKPKDIVAPEVAATMNKRALACIQANSTLEFEDCLTFPNGDVWTTALYTPVHDTAGHIKQIVVTGFDITERKQQELAEQQQREALIEQQSAALMELSTPLLTINEQVVVMPLIGTIDSRRAQQIMESLLSGIAVNEATVAIIDITGVLIVDTQVANALVQSAQAVQLLGSQVILTGIRPEVAQMLVGLGVDLGSIITRSTLQAGIAFAYQKVSPSVQSLSS